MKMTKKLIGVLAALVMASAFVACSNADEETTSTNPDSKIHLSTIKVASTVTYNGVEYWVTKNTFNENRAVNADRSANGSSRAADAITNLAAPTADDESYVSKYFTRDFRDKILKEETGILNYFEILKKGNEKTVSAKGFGVLDDVYLIFDEDFNQIAEFKQTWQSHSLMQYYKPELQTTDARKDAFMEMSIEEIRSWDPQTVVVKHFPGSIEDWKTVELRYNYYDATVNTESEKFQRINFEDRVYRTVARECKHVATGNKFVYKVQTYTDTSKSVNYMLLTNGEDSNSNVINLSVNQAGEGGAINVYGEGTPNGSTDASVYKNGTSFKAKAINVTSTLGESATERWSFSANRDGSNLSVKKQTSNDGKNWTDAESFNESDAPAAEEFFSVSDDKTTVNGTEVPASITYYAHFRQNADGSYPVLDKYAQINCYPVADGETIVYKITQKSIDDYINAYSADFERLAAESVAAN